MAASASAGQQRTHGCPQSTPTLDSSAAFMASRGRTNTLGTDSMAAMDRISLEHLNSGAATIILDSCGSSGNSAITEPTWGGGAGWGRVGGGDGAHRHSLS